MEKIKLLTVLVACSLIFSMFTFYGTFRIATALNKLTTGEAVVTQPSLQGNDAAQKPTAVVAVSSDDDPVLGNKNTKVTIVEFSDYQCPFCRKFWTETFSELKKNYIDTGKVKLVFRDFPLSFHPGAQPAAEAAECARSIGGDEAYWKMHDKIFSEENILDSGSPTGAVSKTVQFTAVDLKKWAKDLGYDIGSCLDSGKFANEVQKDANQGASYGVQGTPAFFVNGKLLSGAYPYASFKQLIDAELAK